ncbi:hypothetical protein H8E07_13670 [bacterium]|nr:hypothetical protein [bacterium]
MGDPRGYWKLPPSEQADAMACHLLEVESMTPRQTTQPGRHGFHALPASVLANRWQKAGVPKSEIDWWMNSDA